MMGMVMESGVKEHGGVEVEVGNFGVGWEV